MLRASPFEQGRTGPPIKGVKMDTASVEKVIAENIRPFVESDGGGIDLVEIRADNTVVIKLSGACCGCPMSTMTLKAGVEEQLKRVFPEIKQVVAA